MSKSDMNPVRYWEYLEGYHAHREEYLQLADKVFSSGRLILGSEVDAFEKEFPSYCGAGFGIGVNSATDALFLALKALNIGNGDEVITVSNTAVPTVAAIRATGATPVFVDVEEETSLIDATLVSGAVRSRTRCILPVHLFGQIVDMAPLQEIAKGHGIQIIEDCAQASGAEYNDRKAGSMGIMGAFSFYPTKVLGAFGDAGMIVTSDKDICKRLRRLRFYGMESGYYAEEEGYNSRLDEIQAAILNFRLTLLDSEITRRREIAKLYDEGLSGIDCLHIPLKKPGRSHQYYLYTIRTPCRDRLMKHLSETGIETKINYPTPIHLMRGYSFLGYREGQLPVTERLAGEILSIPMHPFLNDSDVSRVIESIQDFFKHE